MASKAGRSSFDGANLRELEKRLNQPRDSVQARVRSSSSSQSFSKTLKNFQSAVRSATLGMARSASSLYIYIIVLLLLFILHQLFIWIDEEPDVAFERAALVFEGVEITWDMSRILWNGGVDVLNAGVVPVWNSLAYYLVEPTIVLSLEVFSLLFMKQHWAGIMTEEDFPYNGLDCLANAEAAEWCGRYGYYRQQLEAPARAAIFVNESESFARRFLAEAPPADTVYTFGVATARRLSEQGGGGFAAPAFDTSALTSALQEFTIFFLTMGPSLLDVVFGVLGDVIQTSFSIIMDALFLVLKSLFYVLKMLIKSGMLTTVVAIGVDFVIIYFTEILLPLLFAAIDTLMCLIDYFKPSGWNVQLECVEQTCFKGPDAAADVSTFFSLNIIIGRFAAIMDATMNSRTGKRLFKAPKGSAVTSKGRTRNPETGEVIDNSEPESAGMGNPLYEFDLASAWDDFSSTAGSDECTKCFTCKVPELRMVWWLVASIASLVSPQNFNVFAGNVTASCQTNGSFYQEACGPMGAEQLTYGQWKRRGHTAGVAQMDARIFDSFAAQVVDLNERIGAGRSSDFAQLVQAAHQWQAVSPDSTEERALVFVYQSCRNMRAEAAESGRVVDTPEEYDMLPDGTVERTSSHFLYEICRRFKYEIFTDVGRAAHSFGFQVKACAEDKVVCKKDKIRCLSTCGGKDGSQYKHDFATIVSSTELSRFVLEDGFDTQAAADCTVRSYTFKVPIFKGGDSFATFAARMRTRSGMTAIDTAFCNANAASCGVIQNVLEKAPGLVFVNGEFRHKYTLVPPSPPPSPSPPPRSSPSSPKPPSPPPPPGTPPPSPSKKLNSNQHTTHNTPSHKFYPPLSRTPRSAFRWSPSPRRRWPRCSRSARRRRSAAGSGSAPRARRGCAQPALRTSARPTRRHRRLRSSGTPRPPPACGGSASASATSRPTRRRARPTSPRGRRTPPVPSQAPRRCSMRWERKIPSCRACCAPPRTRSPWRACSDADSCSASSTRRAWRKC